MIPRNRLWCAHLNPRRWAVYMGGVGGMWVVVVNQKVPTNPSSSVVKGGGLSPARTQTQHSCTLIFTFKTLEWCRDVDFKLKL